MTLNFIKGIGNDYVELQRLTGFMACVAGIGYAGIHLIRDHAFNIIEFGTGMGILIAGIGVGAAAKDIGVAKAVATRQASDAAAQEGV